SFPFHVFFHPPPRGRVNLPGLGQAQPQCPGSCLQQLYTNILKKGLTEKVRHIKLAAVSHF
ncbi:MAG: hypothetical protein ACOYI6_01435, partial [Christensenellales bacterium]